MNEEYCEEIKNNLKSIYIEMMNEFQIQQMDAHCYFTTKDLVGDVGMYDFTVINF